MSEYEYLDVIATTREACGYHAMNYISLLFAYVLAGYFAGQTLSRFQVAAITTFYIALCPLPGFTSWETIKEYTALVKRYQLAFGSEEPLSFLVRFGPNLWLGVFAGTFILSILFMVQARKIKENREAAA